MPIGWLDPPCYLLLGGVVSETLGAISAPDYSSILQGLRASRKDFIWAARQNPPPAPDPAPGAPVMIASAYSDIHLYRRGLWVAMPDGTSDKVANVRWHHGQLEVTYVQWGIR
jgi:hypothetical protein